MLVSDGHVHSFDSIMYTCVKTSDFIIEIDTVIYLAIKIFFKKRMGREIHTAENIMKSAPRKVKPVMSGSVDGTDM